MSGFERHTTTGKAFATLSAFEADLLSSLAAQMVELLADEAPPAEPKVGPSMSETESALFGQLDFLDLDSSGPTVAPEDPALARLLPDGHTDDPEAAGEFRRFTEAGLRASKSKAAESIMVALVEAGLPEEIDDPMLMIDIELDVPESIVWMRGFTDMRLAIAARLGIEEGHEDYWASLDDDDPRAAVHDIYEWVGWLQETLVQAIEPD